MCGNIRKEQEALGRTCTHMLLTDGAFSECFEKYRDLRAETRFAKSDPGATLLGRTKSLGMLSEEKKEKNKEKYARNEHKTTPPSVT